jgi:hypothetical protein
MNNRRTFLKSLALFGVAVTLPVQKLFAQITGTTPKPVGDGLTTISYRAEIHPVRKPPRRITIPDSGEFKVLKGDFHIHSLFSDGHVMPRDRVLEAVDNGLDVISITDHIEYRPFIGSRAIRLAENDDHNRGYDLARAEAENRNVILVRGTEITKPMCHFNSIFIEDANAIAAEVADWRNMLAVSKDQGGFNFWNHPDFPRHESLSDAVPFGFVRGEPMQFFDEIEEARAAGLFHGIEVFNGTSYYPIALDWCNERNLVPVTVTDIHQSDWNTYGNQNPLRPMSLILARDRSYESVKEAFFAGRIVGWAANMVLGRSPWVEQLFRSSVEIQRTASGLTLRNLSDIPCFIEAGGRPYPLETLGATATVPGSPTLIVSNWFVGTTKPLEITVS